MKNQNTQTVDIISTPQENYFQLMLNNINESFVLVDKNLVILESNKAAREGIWQKTGMMCCPGQFILEGVEQERIHLLKELFNDVFRGNTRKTEYIYIHDGGETTYLENQVIPARNTRNEIIGAIIYSTDVTEKKKAQLAIQEAEERWQFAFEASNQAAWDWNMKTNEVIYSSSYKKMYGFVENELKNNVNEWQSRIHPDDQSRVSQDVEKHSCAEDFIYETTYRIQLKNGDYRWIMARGKIIDRDEEGKPLRMIGTHTDLTETIKTKEEIRKMNELFVYAAKASSQALWEWDALTDEVYVSPTFTELFGWKTDIIKHFQEWNQFLHPDEIAMVNESLRKKVIKKDESIWQAEYRFLKADGTYAVICNKAYLLRDENGNIVKIIGASQDVTAQKLTEQELYKSNERYDIMLKATSELLWEWDIKSRELYRAKNGLKTVYGLDDDELVKTHEQWLARIHEDDRALVRKKLEEVFVGRNMQIFELEYRFLNGDGDYNYIYGRGILLTDEAGKPVRMIGTEQNISERKRLEQELLNNELEYKKLINQASVDSQEQERSEIGRELHDNINQVLTTTKLYLELSLSNEDMMKELVKKSSKNISKLINEIRQLSRSLMDPTIGDLGIIDSINDLIENINLTRKIHVDLQIDATIEKVLDRNQKLTIFRTIQESLNNIIRHAKATKVTICITQTEQKLNLIIKDDGIGFQTASVKKGAGLKNITNRVYLINGTFQIESKPGDGCQIMISFPIN
jgi:PAS domain S-box-containing protein